MPRNRTEKVLRLGDSYTCAACGNKWRIVGITKRVYRPRHMRHPILKALKGDWICSGCYNWDYDVLDRKRSNSRQPLKLKDGRELTGDF